MDRSARRRALQLGTWLIATAFLVVLIRGVDVGRVWAIGQDVSGAWVALAIGSNLLVLPCWAQQWRMVLPPSSPVPMKRMLPIIAQLAFLGNTIPASGQ